MGLLVANAHGVDIRKFGSGNIGATNVGRRLGMRWGVLVLLLDAAKGLSTSLASGWLVVEYASALDAHPLYLPDLIRLAVAVACVLGNTASPYLGFKGGKGVATALGVLLGIWPHLAWPVALAFLVWAGITLTTKLVALASICAAIAVPVLFLGLGAAFDWDLNKRWPLLALASALAVIVVVRHKSNIERMLRGTEARLGEPDKEPPPGMTEADAS